mmetsp:Transcript_11760/g.28236  ORF Transcript_11760/g.28236 Transcript_11760/m.28236 type:complete len:202 (+) Transcript_11760:2305-2910(+)
MPAVLIVRREDASQLIQIDALGTSRRTMFKGIQLLNEVLELLLETPHELYHRPGEHLHIGLFQDRACEGIADLAHQLAFLHGLVPLPRCHHFNGPSPVDAIQKRAYLTEPRFLGIFLEQVLLHLLPAVLAVHTQQRDGCSRRDDVVGAHNDFLEEIELLLTNPVASVSEAVKTKEVVELVNLVGHNPDVIRLKSPIGQTIL